MRAVCSSGLNRLAVAAVTTGVFVKEHDFYRIGLDANCNEYPLGRSSLKTLCCSEVRKNSAAIFVFVVVFTFTVAFTKVCCGVLMRSIL